LRNAFVPRRMFFTRGVGVHQDKLVSFEMALRDARIPQFNLVRVSSILPPHCEIVTPEEGLPELSPGEVVFCVLAEQASNESGRPIVASVGVAVPTDPSRYGYIAEHHGFDLCAEEAGIYTEQMAITMLATATGDLTCPDFEANERLEHDSIYGHIERTLNMTQGAKGDEAGRWTTVVSAAVFL